MIGSTDSRVVQMHFDNKEFMSKISETIAALDELNKQLATINASKNLGGMRNAIDAEDFSKVASAVDSIKDRFSTLGIVGMTVIQRLTNAGIDMAAKIGGSIKKVSDQIYQGGFVRAKNLEQAKFLLEGLGADVTAVMDDVDRALTGTAYGLDEGAKSAAIFFTSGVKQGQEMYTALRAVAGAAAMTGSTYQGIADVFQDAAAKGSIMTMEINRLQQQGVKADKYLLDFINTVVEGGETVTDVSDDVKKSVMDLTNGTKLSLEDLTEDRKGLLSKGAISFEIFAAAMDEAFGPHAQEANKTFTGSLANMKTALSRLGEMFITPGMKAAIPLFNALQQGIKNFADNLKSLGVVEEYTKGITALGESITSIVTKAQDLGVFQDLAKIFESLMHIGTELYGLFKRIFEEIFPQATIKRFALFVSELQRSLFVFETAKDKFGSLGFTITRFLDNIKDIGGSLKPLLNTIFSIIKNNMGTVSLILTDVFDIITRVIVVFNNLLNKVLLKIQSPLSFILNKIRYITASIAVLDFSFLSQVFGLFGKAAAGLANILGKAFDKILQYFSVFKTGSKNLLTDIHGVTDALGLVGVVFSAGFINKAFKSIKGLFEEKEGIRSIFDNFINSIKSIPDKINATFDQLTKSLEEMQKKVSADIIRSIALAILAMAVALKILSTIDNEDLGRSLAAVTLVIGQLLGTLTVLMNMVSSEKFLKSISDLRKISTLTNQLIKIGFAMILMASALKILSTIDAKGLAVGLTGMTVMLGAVMGFVVGIDKLGGKKAGEKMAGVSAGLTSIAIALVVLSSAVKILSSMNIGELAKGLTSVIVLLGSIMGFIIGISKLSAGGAKGMITAGIGMIAIATALNILAPALEKMGSLSLETIGKGLLAISGALIAMAGASAFTSGIGAAGLTVMTGALVALALTIERVGKLDIKVIALGLGTLVGAIVALAGASMLLSAAIVPMLAMSAAMLLLSTSIAVLGAGLVMIGAGLASIAGGIMAFSSVSQTAVMMFANTVQIMIGALIQMLPQLAVAVAESFVSFLEELASLSSRFKDAVSELISNLIEVFEENAPKMVKAGINFIVEFLSGLEEAMPQISKKAAAVIAGFISGISESMDKIIQAGFDLVISFINGLANGIRNNTEAVRSAIWNLCTAILDAFMSFFGIHSPSTVMEEQGVNLIQGLINGIMSLGGTVGSYLISAIKSGFSAVSRWASKFRSSGLTLIKNIGSGIKSGASNVASCVKSALTSAWNKVKEFGSKFANAGLDLVKGIARGIRNGASNIISATGSIAKKALDHFKNKLKISSPSKVFAETAKWIPEGIVVGINKTSKKVISAVGTMADNTVDAMAEAVSKAYDAVNVNGDFNPTITPVLDLSEVQKDAGNISSMFGTESIALASSLNQNDISTIQNNNLMTQLLTKMDKILNSDNTNGANITNHFTVNGTENPEEFVNTFVNTLNRELKMRAV